MPNRTIDGVEVPSFDDWAQRHKTYVLDNLKHSLYLERYMLIDCFDADVTAFYTTRLNGESKAPYDSFNLALHVGDEEELVLKNRSRLQADFNLEKICFMNQTHSNKVMVVDDHNKGESCFDCDGLVTTQRRVALAVLTADCLPLILCDDFNNVVAAIHCGWRGIQSGIIENAIEVMISQGAKSECIRGFLGPAIGPHSFEVGQDVVDAFAQKGPYYQNCFFEIPYTKEQGQTKYLCHIYRLAVNTLNSLGVEGPIFGGRADTLTQSAVFYSYRKNQQTGRMASVISLN